MGCVNLRQDADDVPLETEDGLCSVCQKLGFDWSWECPECVGAPHSDSKIERHFHIGTVKRLLGKPSCPGCRLILSSLEIPKPSPPSLMEQEIQVSLGFLVNHGAYSENYEDGYELLEATELLDEDATVWVACFEVTLESPRASPDSIRRGRIIRNGPWYAKENNEGDNSELRGRAISPIIDVSIIKDWMRVCEEGHSHCKLLAPLPSGESKFRLIDVQEQRIVDSTHSERYIALSYVWGLATPAVLTKDTLSRYSLKGGLQAIQLPQTIADCMQLVQSLGERYLWVDSLCIIQDDDDDKLEQLRTMDTVYRSATLVVVAAAGNDAHAGLCGVGHLKRSEWQRRETLCGLAHITAQPPLRETLKGTTWSLRGWTFQEAMLARRILFLTNHQMYWSCKRNNWREDMTWDISGDMGLRSSADSFWEAHISQCRTARYCQDVTAFTKRKIREQSDVIWAFMGILKLHASRFPEGFIWGHPLERLDATLLWDGCPGNHQRTAQYPLSFNNGVQSVEYPSWSWLSTDAAVEFESECGDCIISAVSWHKPRLFEDSTAATTGTCTLGSHTKRVFSGSRDDVTKYGLLQCTAETVELTVVRKPSEVKQDDQGPKLLEKHLTRDKNSSYPLLGNDRIEATIYLPSGESAGTVFVYKEFFDGKDHRLGQFILLSANAKKEADETCVEVHGGLDCGNILHGRACKHIQSYNIMLVEQRGDITYRLALHKVESELWQKVKTHKEHFVLG
ncbi:hypothetical protein ACHAPE_003764 [Trichoderma viride]